MKTLSVKEYADKVGMPLATVYHYIHIKRLPEGVEAVKIGSTYILNVTDKALKTKYA